MAIKKRPISPRQKMINLMYVVLMAMLALNVSSEVLDGFTLIDSSIRRTTENATGENEVLYKEFEKLMAANPQKTGLWYRKAKAVREMSSSIYGLADSLKMEIARQADGVDANPDSLRNKENLEAASQVMLSPKDGKGEYLRQSIDAFRSKILSMIDNPSKRKVLEANLSTEVASHEGKNWQEQMFEGMPAVAAVTFLTKLQSDIRYAEGEVLHALMRNVDDKDIRVNSLKAFVIPNAQTVVRGNRFSANIVMAAIDTTQVPDIYIGDKLAALEGGLYETVCNRTGDFTLDGHIELTGKEGEVIRRDFTQKYSVVEPTAIVSADLMNVLYAGYDNPISVSVPGVPLTKVSATMEGGLLSQVAPGRYVAKPSKVGVDAKITVFSSASGSNQQMAQYAFTVRKLPEPSPYINTDKDRFKGGGLQKQQLINAGGIGAAIDDGILDVPFRVLSFETVFFDGHGNAVPQASEGASFSSRQIDTFKRLNRGKRFYITHIKAIGPDGIERKLNTSMEVIVR